jgi:hypothetical protein
MTLVAVCEGCCQEKEVTDVEGHLLCDDCKENVVRCSFCNKFLAVTYDDLTTNIGPLIVPELTLPDEEGSMKFCDVDCLEGYVREYQRKRRDLEKMKKIKINQK